jgi:holliday junction DNA helicase RuvA
MISFLRGELVKKTGGFVWLEVNGLGYEVRISLQTFSALPEKGPIQIFTYFHVREDAQILFGFSTEKEKETFVQLISISGVGPNTALLVLSSLSPDELNQAIVQGDVATIKSVKGIGLKTAERIVLELKDKLGEFTGIETGNIPSNINNTLRDEALSALLTLGFARSAAERGIIQALKEMGPDATLEGVIKWVLKSS